MWLTCSQDGTLGQYGTASLQFQGGPSTGGGVSSSVNTAIVAGVAGGSSLLILIASFAWLRARSRHKELLRKFAGGRRLRDDTGPSGGMSITLSPMYSGRAGAEAKAAHIEEEEDGATALFAGSSARASGRLGMSPVLSTRPGMVENPLLAAGLAGKLRLGTQMQIRQNHGEDVDRVDI